MNRKQLNTICNCADCRDLNASTRRVKRLMYVALAISMAVYVAAVYWQV